MTELLSPGRPLRILIVDDEAPARERMRNLLGDLASQVPSDILGMAANGIEALRLVESEKIDVVLADVSMPVMDGVELARHLSRLPDPPALVFVTAHDDYALQAFELAAVDYLLKPVRAARLAQALHKAGRIRLGAETLASLAPAARRHFSVVERGRVVLLPVDEVLYLRAELKYVTAVTADREWLLDESLVHLEHEFGERFVRIHRNCLIARQAVAALERDPEGQWQVLLRHSGEHLPISRRQLAAVKHALGA